MKSAQDISRLVQLACVWEVCAPKPGNVNRSHDFADTTLEDFLASAIAIGPAFGSTDQASVGRIILNAIADTRRLVRSNTNLGIILLLAPLAKACARASDPGSVREHLTGVLHSLSVEDARLAYAAIRLARPGGLGRVAESDVSAEPAITLLQAMDLAAGRDSIANEYVTNYSITFEIGWPALRDALSRGAGFSTAIVHAYLTILSRVPDTLIVRKMGIKAARRVSQRALAVLDRGGVFTEQGRAALSVMDGELRSEDHSCNPGTTADLTVAAIFLALLESDQGA